MSAGWPGASHNTPEPPVEGGPGTSHRPGGTPGAEGHRRGAKALVAALVLILLIVFVIRNSQRVSIDFILSTGHPRLIWLIVVCTLIGGAVGYFLGRPAGRSRRHRAGGSAAASGEGDLPRP